jgi:hypothetical protein
MSEIIIPGQAPETTKEYKQTLTQPEKLVLPYDAESEENEEVRRILTDADMRARKVQLLGGSFRHLSAEDAKKEGALGVYMAWYPVVYGQIIRYGVHEGVREHWHTGNMYRISPDHRISIQELRNSYPNSDYIMSYSHGNFNRSYGEITSLLSNVSIEDTHVTMEYIEVMNRARFEMEESMQKLMTEYRKFPDGFLSTRPSIVSSGLLRRD